MLKCLSLVPSLFRHHIRQESTPVDFGCLLWVFELDLDAVGADLPVEWVLDHLESIQKGDFHAQGRELIFTNRLESCVLNCRNQSVAHQCLTEWLIVSECADATSKITILLISDEERVLHSLEISRRRFHLLAIRSKEDLQVLK